MLAIFDADCTDMIQIHQQYSLKNNNTFGLDIVSPLFTEPQNTDELVFALNYSGDRSLDRLVIGEGSNLLFTDPFGGLLIRPLMQGIEKVDESASEVLVKAGAGVNWDTFVAHCVQQKWYGTENLSLIPGSVGAAPVQNIGAYGVEAKDIIEYVEVVDTIAMKPAVLSNAECEFGYRDSIFKHGAHDRYIVTGVVFRLKKMGELLLDYGNVKELFLKAPMQDLQGLRDTIIAIRQSKLPDPEVSGNAGSFFKNPVISKEQFLQIEAEYASVPNYPAGPDRVKVPAAWLIEQSGWKGVREEDVGTWPLQPLVIVNYGAATGKEIFIFSEKIRQSIIEKFNIDLEREVTVIGN
jgi:UDP-N-acetylmuramate dehydrogenase